ncbi:MAG TPA: hypothetical protein VF037_07955 [Gemmatimonadales bacterium]
MRLADFEAMVRRLSSEVPAHFFDGIAEVVVSPRAVPHPVRADIYTLGECIPLDVGEGGDDLQSRIVLYHGSFAALARLEPGYDWRGEAWETLTHELRHHLEWRARAPDLEAYDEAAEQNFARHDGEPFDPGFYLDGEVAADGVYSVDDDYFLDRVVKALPETVEFTWHGAQYRVEVPRGAALPAFLAVEGVAEPPPGELVLALRRRPGLRDLFRRAAPFEATVAARPL